MDKTYYLPERLFWTVFLLLKLKGQREVPYWKRDQLEKVRNRRLRRILRYAALRVPYYRELFSRKGMDLDDFQTVDDLARLPVLTPLEVRKNPERFRPEGRRRETIRLLSSGTTGVPRWVDHDAVSVFTNAAHGERIRHFTSSVRKKTRNYREALIVVPLGSASQELQEYVSRKAFIPRWKRPERRYFSMLDDMKSVLDRVHEFAPDVIRGYGSGLNLMFEEVFRSNRDFHLPSSLVYSADIMTPAIRMRIKEDLGIPVYSLYSSVESPQIGFECGEHQGYHINEDCYPVRVVDEQYNPVPEGQAGRIIISNLINRAFVLLNYELGDEGSILPGNCACGRTLKMLNLEISRIADQVDLENGRSFHPITFSEAVCMEKDIWQHQAVQKEGNKFDLFLVTDPEADRQAMERRLCKEFEKWFSGKLRVDIRFVDRIEPTPGGKHRALVLKPRE